MVFRSNRRSVQPMRTFIHCLSLTLMLTASVTYGSSCVNRLDLVMAVDTASSLSPDSFEAVKAEVKDIVSGLTVGQANTRLAVIGMSKTATVVANFNAVNSVADFNSAIDRLTFSTETVDLSEGVTVAREAVLSTARTGKVARVLVLVKDRRSIGASEAAAAALSKLSTEAASVRALGAVINAVGIGGLWSRQELTAIFGSEYLLFKGKNRALESVKSLNNFICKAACPNKGTATQRAGLCYKALKHVIHTKVDLVDSSTGLSVCRKEISREFTPCAEKQRCILTDRTIGPCLNGQATIENVWQSFDYRVQACVTNKTSQTVACYETMKCTHQMADVIFILDKSGSIGNNFPKVRRATNAMISALNIGPRGVRVGVITFGTGVAVEVTLDSTTDRDALVRAVNSISDHIASMERTYTHLALESARNMLSGQARPEVPRFVMIITDGDSWFPIRTMKETVLLKNAGATVYAIGVGKVLESELRMMTSPDSDANTVIVNDFNVLLTWAQQFSKKLCLEFSAPSPRLCDGGSFVQAVSECIQGKHQVTRTDYVYSAANKCIKSIKSTEHFGCKEKCIDPIDGNEYLQSDSWTNLCHDFQCKDAKSPLVPIRTKCMAADGSCRDAGAPAFKCRDEKGVEVSNCQCVQQGGKATLVIESD